MKIFKVEQISRPQNLMIAVQSVPPLDRACSAPVLWALVGVINANMSDPNLPVIALALIGSVALALWTLMSLRKDAQS